MCLRAHTPGFVAAWGPSCSVALTLRSPPGYSLPAQAGTSLCRKPAAGPFVRAAAQLGDSLIRPLQQRGRPALIR